ncbi:hypothetical protein [Natronorubrum sp. FCH18a]|uniref:hypothetical protein n=1 Tax=Natronorubrum sp. FCH18a TaxID=3447018 RepID=UPI003F5111C5
MDDTTVLEGPVTSIYSPPQQRKTGIRKPILALADDKHVVIVADKRGPDGLLPILCSMMSLHGIGRVPAPPTVLISDPQFDESESISVRTEETHLENVYTAVDSPEVNPHQ